ncbi:MAG TPA: hypothetical protein VF989_12165 [Polyangiaceae bacterium]
MSKEFPRVRHLPPGHELVAAIERDAPPLSRWVQATGHVDEVELRLSGVGADPRRALRSRHALVTLSGPVGGPYGVVLVREQNKQSELVAGHLLRATSHGVWIHYSLESGEAGGDGQQAVAAGASLEAPGQPPEAEQDEPPRTASGGAGWAARARAAAREHGATEEEPIVPPKRGDRVHHFSFGLCDVLSSDGERLRIRDARGPGRIREVRLSMLEVNVPVVRDGKRVFDLGRKE